MNKLYTTSPTRIYLLTFTHTHTLMHIYIYIYIYTIFNYENKALI